MKNLQIILFFLLLSSCANIVSPSGGDKDTEAPKLKIAKPANKSVNFQGKKIEIKFDEFIRFKSSADNIFISPALKMNPKYSLIGKKVKIEFKEDLLENTTYTIFFNNSIEDYNEGNKLDNFSYVFSTGTFLDSLQIEGNVLNTFDNTALKDVSILLYPASEDSILYKKPLYYTKTDASGHYTLSNLKEGKYKIACLEDKNLNYIYDQENEKISFSTEEINLKEDLIVLPFYLFENSKKTKIIDYKVNDSYVAFELNKAINNVNIECSNASEEDIQYLSKDKQTIYYWFQNKTEESTFYINGPNLSDTLIIDLTKTEKDTQSFDIKYHSFFQEDKNCIVLDFPFPIYNYEKDKISVQNLSKNNISFTGEWKQNKTQFIIKPNAALDSLVLNIKTNTFTSFHSKKNNSIVNQVISFDYSVSNLTILLPEDSLNKVVQLYTKDMDLLEEQFVSRETKVVFKNIDSDTYFLRIFEDKNNNKQWDNGLFHVKQFPEKTLFFSNKIEIKPNWDKELVVTY